MSALYAASILGDRIRSSRVSSKIPIAACCNHLPSRCTFSSSTQTNSNGEREWTLLYRRDPGKSTSPRAMLGISSFNFTYWTWYNFDFVPAMNASAQTKAELGQISQETLEMLLVDPKMGFVGLGMATAIFGGAIFYARSLVNAIWAPKGAAGAKGSPLAVSTLKLPFLRQAAILDKTVYDPDSNNFNAMEDIVFTESELKAESTVELYAAGELALSEANKKNDVLVTFEGDFSKLRGHTPLKIEDGEGDVGPISSLLKQRYLLDITEGEVMPNASPILLDSLVLGDLHMNDEKKGGGREAKTRSEATTAAPVRTNISKSIKRKKGYRKKR
ncbi:hypothetical protein ACHAXT_004591 [Thalassiosira profunda]